MQREIALTNCPKFSLQRLAEGKHEGEFITSKDIKEHTVLLSEKCQCVSRNEGQGEEMYRGMRRQHFTKQSGKVKRKPLILTHLSNKERNKGDLGTGRGYRALGQQPTGQVDGQLCIEMLEGRDGGESCGWK